MVIDKEIQVSDEESNKEYSSEISDSHLKFENNIHQDIDFANDNIVDESEYSNDNSDTDLTEDFEDFQMEQQGQQGHHIE